MTMKVGVIVFMFFCLWMNCRSGLTWWMMVYDDGMDYSRDYMN